MELTKEWIENFHRKTMGFVGGFEIFEDFENKERYIESETGMTFLLEEMDFHEDWNWIMKIIEKIEHIPFSVMISPWGCGIIMWEDTIPKDWMGSDFKNIHIWGGKGYKISKKDAVIKAIDEFIDWYNKKEMMYFETLLKPLGEVKVVLIPHGQKRESISINRYEYLDINMDTGEFYIRNKFTGSNVIKASSGELAVMDKKFLNRIKEDETKLFDRIDEWTYTPATGSREVTRGI